MSLTLSPLEICLRLLLALSCSALLGYDRGERDRPAGTRTTMLVCLAATFAMLQANLMMPLRDQGTGHLLTMDAMRLPLGILSGIGFIGAGAILRRGDVVIGVTTAATLWYVTVLGILFGAGQNWLGLLAAALGWFILQVLKCVRPYVARQHHGTVTVTFNGNAPPEQQWRLALEHAGLQPRTWNAIYAPPQGLQQISCEVQWTARPRDRDGLSPSALNQLRDTSGVCRFEFRH